MHITAKEQFLHKLIASSAFCCALCILPVAQYFLVTNQPGKTQGDVAGVSTDTTITKASIQSQPECEAQRTKDLSDLQRYAVGTGIAYDKALEAKVTPYKEAIKALQGSTESIASETAALNNLIEAENQPYLKKLADLDSAVASQKKEIESRSCSAE